jgi:non-ribosomal peptide synthetase component F/acyl carrier protein
VVISHRSLVAHVLAFADHTGAGPDTRAFGFTALGFDVSVHDLLVPLAVGGSVALADEADRADPQRLQRFAVEHRVNWGFVPPTLLPLLVPDGLPDWRTVYTGAEAPGPEQVARWTEGAVHRRFVHAYGPTEATVCVTAFDASGHWDRPLPIGRPLPNHRLVVVDEQLRPLGVGEPGELLIGGVGLARGYLGDAALTAQRFVPDPFGAQPGQRLFRTGDRVVWLDDGTLRFLGRADRQVKIRGQRVELGEPETVLRGHPGVRHAVVDVVDGQLVAFCTLPDPGAAGAPDEHDLLAYCEQRLPAVMVPSRVLRLAQLPLTASGKVDFAALRRHLIDAEPDREAALPVTELQRRLAELWTQALDGGRLHDREQVRLTDDFFAAGGHSIAVMRLVAAIRAELRRDVAAEDVFAGRTLAGLASRVAAAAVLDGTVLDGTVLDSAALGGAARDRGHSPVLSPSQRRLWFLDKLAPHSAAYNIAFAERLTGELDVAALRAALTAVATRHEVLRWRIIDVAGAPHPVCDPPAEVALPVIELTRPQELSGRLAEAAGTVFDLARGPLWRAVLYRLGPREHVLSLSLHHAVCDGWSQAVLYRDLAAAYAGEPLPPVRASYADYAVWRAEHDQRHGADDLAWWTNHLRGAPTVLELPADRPRPPVQSYAGAFASTALPASTDAAIRSLAAELGATPSAVLLAALGELLRRLTGATDGADGADGADHVIGAVVADRRLAEVADLVGFFVDIVPVRLRAAGGETFAGAVAAALAELLDATGHAAPLEEIVGALGVRRDPSRSPLVQVLFNVYNFAEPSLRLPGLAAETVRVPMPGSPFDLTVYLVERGRPGEPGRFALDVVYNPQLFDAARIKAFLRDYSALLAALTTRSGEPLPAVTVPMASPPGLVSGPAAAGAGVRPRGPAEPATATERLVARAWCEVLRLPAVRATDNFFDIGGDSMAMVAVHARLTELLDRRLEVVELFQWPNVRALAGHLDGTVPDRPVSRGLQRGAARRAAARRNRAPRDRARSID